MRVIAEDNARDCRRDEGACDQAMSLQGERLRFDGFAGKDRGTRAVYRTRSTVEGNSPSKTKKWSGTDLKLP
jgi:hypothetical protein